MLQEQTSRHSQSAENTNETIRVAMVISRFWRIWRIWRFCRAFQLYLELAFADLQGFDLVFKAGRQFQPISLGKGQGPNGPG